MYERKFAQVIDQFIDDLLQEKNRQFIIQAIEPELEKFFETVRAVKRLRTKKKSSSFLKHAGLKACSLLQQRWHWFWGWRYCPVRIK